jgi:hypothetical protein
MYKVKKHGEENFLPYVSVTTVLGELDKSDGLIPWALRLQSEYILKHGKPTVIDETTGSIEEVNVSRETMKLAAVNFREESTKAMDIGSSVHALIDYYIQHNKDKTKANEYPEQVQKAFSAFLDWEKKNDVIWLENERPVVDEGECYAGTLDALAVLPRFSTVPFVVDFKSSNRIYPEHWLQVCAYARARRQMCGRYDFEVIMDDKEPFTTSSDYISMKSELNVGILRLDKETGIPEFSGYTDKEKITADGEEYKTKSLNGEQYIKRQTAAFTALMAFYYLHKDRQGMYATASGNVGNVRANMVRSGYGYGVKPPAKSKTARKTTKKKGK